MMIAFGLGDGRYGLDSRAVAAVTVWAALKPSPSQNPAVVGILDYHGAAVAVVDLSRLVLGRSCAVRLSTRILLVPVGSDLAGLLVERAYEMLDLSAPPASAEGLRIFEVSPDGSCLEKTIEVGGLLRPLIKSLSPNA